MNEIVFMLFLLNWYFYLILRFKVRKTLIKYLLPLNGMFHASYTNCIVYKCAVLYAWFSAYKRTRVQGPVLQRDYSLTENYCTVYID